MPFKLVRCLPLPGALAYCSHDSKVLAVCFFFFKDLVSFVVHNYRYRLTGLPVDYQHKNITSPDVTNLLLEDLIIWTNYEIEVAAYNGAGLGTFSHKVTEWTLQGGEGTYD